MKATKKAISEINQIKLQVMTTLFILAQAIRNGLTNNEMCFLPTGSPVSFKTYIGDLSATGKHSIDDFVPAGLFIWGEDNFISIPCTVFTNYKNGQKVAFYSLQQLV